MLHRIPFFARTSFLLALAISFTATMGCGDDPEEAAAAAAAVASGQVPGAAGTAPSAASSPAAVPAASPTNPGDISPEKECQIESVCERKCAVECQLEERDRTAYYQAKRSRIQSAPFEVKVQRVFLSGSCHKGDDPAKRRDSSGVKAIVEGNMTYNGEDMLYEADMEGSFYLRFGPSRYAEVSAAGRSYTGYYGRPKVLSRFTQAVRGADPWIKGETRPFHWESNYLNEVFCEATPDEATAYIELNTWGVRAGRKDFPVTFVPVHWDEVLGMALRQQVTIQKIVKKEIEEEPADAHYSQLDKILVTRLTGKTEWIKRTSVVSGNLDKGPSAAFPMETSTEQWKVKVTGISAAPEFGGYAPKGEDQFLAIVDMELTYNGVEEGSMKGFGARLETSVGKWSSPISKAVGQIDTASPLSPGSSVAGKVVFPRQRFERPFRIEIKTPDKNSVFLDVLSYDLGPERRP